MQDRPRVRLCLLFLCAIGCAPVAAVVGHAGQADAERLRLAAPQVAVGEVLPDGGCTLVAPRWALTAAHVASGLKPGARVRFGEYEATVARIILHPEGTAPRGQPPEVDLALLQFEAEVPGVAPLPIYRGDDEAGRTLLVVGYGDHGNAGQALARGDGRRRAVTNEVSDAGPRRLFLRFDAPPAGTAMEGVGGPGDSGGPALLEAKGKSYLAGVSSASMDGKPGQYGVVDVYVRVGSYADWIDATIAAP
jgi:hypothetical protein